MGPAFATYHTLFEKSERALKQGGVLAFTAEWAAEDDGKAAAGWSLLSSGRFAHRAGYLRRLAHANGFEVRAHERIVPRMEDERPVQGQLWVLMRR